MHTSGVISRECRRRNSCSWRCCVEAEGSPRHPAAPPRAGAPTTPDAPIVDDDVLPEGAGTPLMVEQKGQRMWSTRCAVMKMPEQV